MSVVCGIVHVNLSTFATRLEDTRHFKESLCKVGLEVHEVQEDGWALKVLHSYVDSVQRNFFVPYFKKTPRTI
jgi:hypothetical protein